MESLEAELDRARRLDAGTLADAIESIGFECTRCGGCCKGETDEPHTATVFPDEVRELQATAADADADRGDSEGAESDADDRGSVRDADDRGSVRDADDRGSDRRNVDDAAADGEPTEYDWRDVARPMPYGLTEGERGLEGETFEWALQTDACGDCRFYEEGPSADGTEVGDGTHPDPDQPGDGYCTVHEDRPLICRTYPFSLALAGTSQPMGEAVDEEGMVRAHECEGLGREIDPDDARELAETLKRRAIRELEEAIAVRDAYEPLRAAEGEIVVHDSEGAKDRDGRSRE